jgi:hypothetical protein
MRMFRSTTTSLALVAALGVATTAHGVLAPSKASQLVTVYGVGGCPLPGFNVASSVTFTQMVRNDGSIIPFAIPAKQVFVLVDAMVTASGEPAGDTMLAAVAVGTPASGAPIAARWESVAAGGTVTGSFEFPTGIAIKSTSVMCAQLLNFTHAGSVGTSAIAHGFFAPDK